MADGVGNFRSPVLNEPMLTSSSSIMRTPLGNVRSTSVQGPPPLPPAVHTQLNNYAGGIGGAGYSPMYGGGTFGGYGGAGYGGYGGMSNYGGMSSYGGFGGYGGGYGGFGGFNSFNRFGGGSFLNPNDPENQFIQLAEESSRPAFQSIESVVGAIGNIAAMLDSTFFAITSTFRAILGVTANFGRLRGVFTQFWQTFALVRGLTWLYKKLLYLMRISKTDPSSFAFKEAFAAAQSAAPGGGPPLPGTGAGGGGSALPVLAFLGFIFTAPYLIMKLFGDVTKAAKEESRNPKTWVRPIPTCALYDFQARNPTELSMRAGQTVLIGPKEIQNTHKLMNTGWALASADGVHSGLIPISYVQGPNQMKSQVPDIAQLNPAAGFNLHTPEQAAVTPRTEGPQINPKRAEAPHGLSKQGTNLLPVIPESSEYSDPPASPET